MKRGIFFVSIILIVISINLISASLISLNESGAWQSNLTPVRFSATTLGDLNNDGKIDLAVMGCIGNPGQDRCNAGVLTKIYINNGTSLVENASWDGNLTKVAMGSITFGDVNNDGKPDLILTGCDNSDDAINGGCTGNMSSKVYINNGTSLTESSQWQSNLSIVYRSSSYVGDVNNDGKLDLALIGMTSSGNPISKIYINNGTSLTESTQWQSNLIQTYNGQILLTDFNNDGKLDLALSGGDLGAYPRIQKIYINNGTSLVGDNIWSYGLDHLNSGTYLQYISLASTDYNNDGKMDLITTGIGDYTYVLKNNGTSLLVNQSSNVPLTSGWIIGLYHASLAFGDYDNDGYLDLAAMGHEAFAHYTRIYKNNASNNNYFVQDANAHANISDGLFEGSWTFGDVNNDGYLDLVATGLDLDNGPSIAKVYINNGTAANNRPLPPNSSFSSSYSTSTAQLSLAWGNGSDVETGTSGLYYNIMGGNATDNNTIVSGVYGGSSGGGAGVGGGQGGYFGNMQEGKNITFNVNLTDGTYYWYVQTIDTALATSNWSARQSFVVSNPPSQEAPSNPVVFNGGGGSYNPPKTLQKFDIDFSAVNNGVLEAKQGDIKTISFNGETTHKITVTEVTTISAKMIIESEPIIIVLNTGEMQKIDINKDRIDDVEIRIISILSGSVTFVMTKLSGADILAQSETGKPALFDVKITIPDKYKNIFLGGEITSSIEVFNVNSVGKVDVVLNYYITDRENKTKIAAGTDTLAVETVTSFVRTLTTPITTKPGIYAFVVDVSYKNVTTSSRAEFTINNLLNGKEMIIGGIILVILMLGIIAYLVVMRIKEDKIIQKKVEEALLKEEKKIKEGKINKKN